MTKFVKMLHNFGAPLLRSPLTFKNAITNHTKGMSQSRGLGFLIVDENYNLVTSVKAGNPDTWYSHDPENYLSDVVLEHEIEADDIFAGHMDFITSEIGK